MPPNYKGRLFETVIAVNMNSPKLWSRFYKAVQLHRPCPYI